MGSTLSIAIPATNLQLADSVLSDGTPIRRIKRYAIQVGKKYVKKLKSGIQVIDASVERCQHWLSMWQECKKNGLPVKVTKDHQNRMKAENILGDLADMTIENGWVTLALDIRGADNIALAEANKDVSIEVDLSGVDGSGNTYKDFIAAVTFTPIPVVTNQPIAASMADDDGPYVLSQEQKMNDTLRMSLCKLSGKKADEINDDNAAECIEQHLAMCSANATKMSQLEAQVTKLSQESKPNTRYLALAARSAATPFEQLKELGVLDVACADGLQKLIIGHKEADGWVFSNIALSMSADGEDEKVIDLAEKIAALLKANKPVATKELTHGQIRLSREIPGASGDPKLTKIKSPWTGAEVEVQA